MNDLESTRQVYDMVILASEARYWYFLIGSTLAGFYSGCRASPSFDRTKKKVCCGIRGGS